MKLFLVTMVCFSGLMAFTLEVKKSPVILQINEHNKSYIKGEKVTLKGGNLVCFVEGTGRVIIKGEGFEKQLSEHNPICTELPIKKTKSEQKTSFLSSIKNRVITFLGDAVESEQEGLSRTYETQENNVSKTIFLNKNDKFIYIKSSEWGPLPVTLSIFNSESNVTHTFKNEDDLTTLFIVPWYLVHNKDIIKITNRFDDVLATLLIKVTQDNGDKKE